jgi:hypothetical protein
MGTIKHRSSCLVDAMADTFSASVRCEAAAYQGSNKEVHRYLVSIPLQLCLKSSNNFFRQQSNFPRTAPKNVTHHIDYEILI